ncbi:MAG: CocE/NonD family hydrolase, partial [Acidobacteriaceae bacterium]
MHARLRGTATLWFAALLCAGVPSLIAQNPPAAAVAKPVTLTTQQLDALVGQYRLEGEQSVVYSFSSDGKTLSLAGPRIMPTPLTAVSPMRFAAPDGGPEFTFTLTPQGHAESVMRKGSDAPARLFDPHPAHYTFRPYTRQEAMIPMRDGIKLHAVILRPTDDPANGNDPLPFLMERTPYGVDDVTPAAVTYRYTELAQSGYIFVDEDIRGRYKSEGTFVMMRPLLDQHSTDQHGAERHSTDQHSTGQDGAPESQVSGSKATDESTDSYDTVAWLLKNIPNNNGRVGAAGISYPGGMAQDAGIGAHPAVRAISPQAPMIDVWKGDDFFHNGAFRETYGYDYVLGMESGKTTTFQKLDQDAYTYFLNAGSYAAAAKQGKIAQLPTAQAFFAHPAYDSYWQARGVESHLTSLSVPSLEVGGYWDQEDMWGPQAAYAALRKQDPSSRDLFLVLGPWRHGGWAGSTERLGAVDFGEPTSDDYRTRIEAPFFEHYLKDKGTFDAGGAMTFQTGSDQWKHYASWPPSDAHNGNLYLGADGALSFQQKEAPDATGFATYVSDPANPVPYRARPIQATYAPGSKWG